MNHHTIDILILTDVDPNELTGLINQPGLLGTWTENQTIHVYWDPDHWSPQAQASIYTALHTLGMAHPEELVSTHTLPTQDWDARWARQVKPIRIGKRVRIRPSWEPASTNPQDIDLVIDPKQAFGTGHHATTRLVDRMARKRDLRRGNPLRHRHGFGHSGDGGHTIGCSESLGARLRCTSN